MDLTEENKLSLNIILLLIILFLESGSTATLTRHEYYSMPEDRALKISLGYYEDTYLNFTELTTKYGYPSEEHTVTTEDGYILTIFRILPKCEQPVNRYPAILVHGIFDSSDTWIFSGPETGLGYVLARDCYDVWAANHRGNYYSRQHIKLNPDKDSKFWNYSFDEHGNFDLPAIIDYVLTMTKKNKVNYIGHSQGTTDFFALASLKPEYNEKIQLSIHVAPVAWLGNIRSPFPKFLAGISKEIKIFLDSIGLNELFAKHQLPHVVLEILCQFAPNEVCGIGLAISTGYQIDSIHPRTLAVAFGHLPVGISVKSLAHFGQLIGSHKFARYDEGIQGNIKRYGMPKPPEYNVTKITSPVLLVCAQNDWISSIEDSNILKSKLPNVVDHYIVPETHWSHNDLLWSDDAPKIVFTKLMNDLNNFN